MKMAFCFAVENSPRNDNRNLNSFRSSSKTCSSFSSGSIITARLTYVGARKKRRVARMRKSTIIRLGDNFDKAIRGTRCSGCHLDISLSLMVCVTFIFVVYIERIYSALCFDSGLDENGAFLAINVEQGVRLRQGISCHLFKYVKSHKAGIKYIFRISEA